MLRTTAALVGGIVVVGIVFGIPAGATAQSFGIGPRIAFMAGSENPALSGSGQTEAKFTGGFVRLRSGRVGVEGAFDYRTMKDSAEIATLKSYPLHGSLLYYLTNRAISPYLIGGLDDYTHKLNASAAGSESASATAHNLGYHAGMGAEMWLGKHASVFLDYRYTFVDLPDFGDLPRALLGSAFNPAKLVTGDGVGVDTNGSMWTTGMTIYF